MADFNPYHHFGFLTHRVARLMDQFMEPMLKSKGYHFPVSCIGILADLWSGDGITQKELGTSMVKTKSSVNKMLEALENHGLVTKKVDPDDKRNKLIFLTAKGHEFRELLEKQSLFYQSKYLQEHSDEEINIAKSVLKSIYLNLKDKVKTAY
ncbi:MarR family winged helix-turn-helix transcriptional regulator [Portibacter marinus]|uniref:MarR family winged helix-turn-helix transcriptional regulator n=1 Tax=Portibacter marinus TaxID=2898660 RepID=UPI001F442439|nr:MarR family transcriptional regulator [Portibacter marinus]